MSQRTGQVRRSNIQNGSYRLQAQQDAASGPAEQGAVTSIAEDMTASGTLSGSGTLLVEGTVVGKIKLNGAVTVAGTGIVKGPIEADTVRIAGRVEGDITARTKLLLDMSGSIKGDVTTCSFTIEDGGYFNGRSHMTKAGREPVVVY